MTCEAEINLEFEMNLKSVINLEYKMNLESEINLKSEIHLESTRESGNEVRDDPMKSTRISGRYTPLILGWGLHPMGGPSAPRGWASPIL